MQMKTVIENEFFFRIDYSGGAAACCPADLQNRYFCVSKSEYKSELAPGKFSIQECRIFCVCKSCRTENAGV